MPLKIEPEEEDEDWSDDDDEIMAQQRAEFAKLFGASVQSLVDSKADEEFFNSVDKYDCSRNHSITSSGLSLLLKNVTWL